MPAKTRYSAQERAQGLRSYDEIGRSIASLVVDHGKPTDQAWALIRDIGLYERWELDFWLQSYRRERRSEMQAKEARERRKQKMAEKLERAKPRKLLKALRKSTHGRNS